LIAKLILGSALVLSTATPALATTGADIARSKDYAAQLGPNAQTRYAAIFASIRAAQWDDAKARIAAMPDGPLHAVALAELYLAKGSPKVSGEELSALIEKAPHLPQAAQLQRLARTRGIVADFSIPSARELGWLGSAPRRTRLTRTPDALAASLNARIQPLIKDNRPNDAETLIIENEATLTPEGLTELRQRVAWSYYITGDDEAARRLATQAQGGIGEWAALADWTVGLANWRMKNFSGAAQAFEAAALRFDSEDMDAAAHFWAARAYMASGEPQRIDTHLKSAARRSETFYGLLALERLGLKPTPVAPEGIGSVEKLPNVKAALALAEIGERDLADQMIRHQARIGDARDHASLAVLAGRLDLPATQLWLAHNGPAGARAPVTARYPMPKGWRPDGGWRVDRSLVFAHALQESQFRTNVTSPAGARGLMQVMPGTAGDIARSRGQSVGSLGTASTNLEYGQTYIEMIRDMGATGGMLPKVIAAYNAGPAPVGVWNQRTRDNGDPLLYIESIPYWETRAYVTIIMRNYWMYQLQSGDKTTSLTALSQGYWPRFPGLPGPAMVRLDRVGGVASAD
jgi:soluble lytic murein transglycosylase